MTGKREGPNVSPSPGIRAIAASDTTYSSGTVVLSGGANITVGTNGQTITISGGAGGGAGYTAGMSNVGNTSGTTGVADRRLVLAGGNNVTLSQSLDAANSSATITISVPNTSSQTVQTQNLHNVTLSGNTAGVMAHISSGTMTLAGGNNITVSQNGNAVTISGGAGAGGFAGGGISGGNTAGDTGSVTGRLIFAGGNNVTLSGSTNGGSMTITVSGGAGGAETQTAISGLAGSNTTYTSGTVILSNQANVTIGSSIDGASQYLRLSGNAAQTGTQFSGGLSNIGNTAGDTGTVAGRLVLAGGNRITLSGSTNGASETVTISAPNAQTGISGVGASDTTYSSGTVIVSGQANVTVGSSVDGASQYVRLSVADPGAGGGATIKMLKMLPEGMWGSINNNAIANASLQLVPLMVPANLTAHSADIFVSASGASGSSASALWSIGIYTENANTLSLASSASSASSWTSGTNASNNWSGVFGYRRWAISNANFSFTPGNYVVGIWHRSSNAGTFTMAGNRGIAANHSGILGSSVNSSYVAMPWNGFYSASTSGGLPSSIGKNQLTKDFPPSANVFTPDVMFANSEWDW